MVCTNCSADIPEHAAKCLACGAAPTLVPRKRSPFEISTQATVTPTATATSRSSHPNRIGRFEISAMLGKGGMGVVYRARDPELAIDVAIKALPAESIRDPKERERLKREIVTARAITHPNVIRIHEFGLGEDPFICMELLTGGSLADRLDKAALPTDDAVHICRQLADGLAAAHRQGVIHRDVKPLNVLFAADGTPKLVDFGLARVADTTSSTLGFSGTPNYMSPEMADGRDLTVASDVYSFGVLLFECATGRLPFEGENLVRLVTLHTKEPPPRPSSVRPGVPKPLEDVILRCLEKRPEDRFQDASEVAAALAAIEIGKPLEVAPRRRGRAGAPLFAGLALLAVAGGAFGLHAWSARGTPPVPSDATPAPTATVVELLPGATPTALAIASRAPVRPTPARTHAAVAPTPPSGGPVSITVRGRPWFKIYVGSAYKGNTNPDGVRLTLSPGITQVTAVNPGVGSITCPVTVPFPTGRSATVFVDGDTRHCRIGD